MIILMVVSWTSRARRQTDFLFGSFFWYTQEVKETTIKAEQYPGMVDEINPYGKTMPSFRQQNTFEQIVDLDFQGNKKLLNGSFATRELYGFVCLKMSLSQVGLKVDPLGFTPLKLNESPLKNELIGKIRSFPLKMVKHIMSKLLIVKLHHYIFRIHMFSNQSFFFQASSFFG